IMIVATTNVMAGTNNALENSSNLTLSRNGLEANALAGVITANFSPLLKTTTSQSQVSGKITDDTGMSLPGVSVKIKDSNIGTVSGVDGNYTLPAAGANTVLVFSYLGFETQEVVVGNQSTINVTLVPSKSSLEEVVVVGYGTQKRTTLTGSVVDVSGEELTKSPNANVTASLQGKLPGMIAVQRTGEPGRDDANILIRGNGTTGNNSPLIIIDGVERSLMGRLNNEDIETISVLKDASAAIYGARAANGVILITTKQGKIGKPEFSVSLNNAFSHPTKVPDMLDAVTFAQVY